LIAFLDDISPVLQALIATFFTWSLTAFGAAFVFGMKNFKLTYGYLQGVLHWMPFCTIVHRVLQTKAIQISPL